MKLSVMERVDKSPASSQPLATRRHVMSLKTVHHSKVLLEIQIHISSSECLAKTLTQQRSHSGIRQRHVFIFPL